MSRSSDDLDLRFRWGLTALLLSIAAFGAIDLGFDRPTSLWTLHVVVELAFVTLCLMATVFLWSGWRGAHRRLQGSRADLVSREAERDLWRDKATRLLRGLGVEIEAQFERWALTPAEKQVALLLLKGLGHKEAAEVLDRSERTIRQHAVAVYRKAGLAGRAELAAFFLEDLLLPQDAAEHERPSVDPNPNPAPTPDPDLEEKTWISS
jgi:DNA-binding CsgD family transcriptional regulator